MFRSQRRDKYPMSNHTPFTSSKYVNEVPFIFPLAIFFNPHKCVLLTQAAVIHCRRHP